MTTIRKDRQVILEQRRQRVRLSAAATRTREMWLLLPATIIVAAALWLVYQAQVGRLGTLEADVRQGKVLILAPETSAEILVSHLRVLDYPQDREFAAQRIQRALHTAQQFPNAGAIGRILIGQKDIEANRSLVDLPRRLAAAKERQEQLEKQRLARRGWYGRLKAWVKSHFAEEEKPEVRVSILSAQQLAAWKPTIAVRSVSEFRRSFFLWSVLSILSFYLAHLFFRIRRFGGDNALLPMVLMLSGIGLALMVSLRDPVRDSMIFRDFATGIVGGIVLMAVASQVNLEQHTRRFTYLPLLAAIVLSVALFALGTGPTGSDAKVNLFGLQPVEAIRILLVLFLAGYFGSNWDALRELRPQGGAFSRIAGMLHIARLDYTLPVFIGVVVSLVFFFLLRDMGPALVIGCLFLTLYSIARASFRLAGFGLMLILAGFLFGYWTGEPETVQDRTDMWLNIWNNHVRGGDQVAHSLWSFSTGALTGTGLGLGQPQSVPAGHTDLILSVYAEQMGFLGFLMLMTLYVLFFHRALRIALRAPGSYSFFLASGLTLITAVQFVVISGGILGLSPLSGVVTPFLSYGRSSMLSNFVILGILLAISAQPAKDQRLHFGKPLAHISKLLAFAAIVFSARAAWFQVAKPDETLLKGALVVNADGIRRYEYNPRIMTAARMIPKGDIYDRHGLPLATSDFAKIEGRRKDYETLGVNLSTTAHYLDRRHYPLGPQMFYVLGDTRSPLKRGARNAAFEESRSRLRLQGFDDGIEVEEEKVPDSDEAIHRLKFDYKELLPLIRHQWESDHPAVRELLARPRDVRMTIDARMQMTLSQILQRALLKQKKERGAIVVLDPENGDLLASVSYPWPTQSQLNPLQAMNSTGGVPEELLLDRARYGLYPPGSSFKVVTSIAAIRKDPALFNQKHDCVRLPDGRVGTTIKGFKRPIRDDVMDRSPHGSLSLAQALVVSCNAYFAQLGYYDIGAQDLFDTASIFGIAMARPNTVKELQQYLHQSSYGQGEVVVTPFQMARVAATIANGGQMPYGRWVMDESNSRTEEPRRVIPEEQSNKIALAMRNVVTQGTGRAAAGGTNISGKTGTAELAKQLSHAWFIGFAPIGTSGRKIAFAVLVENGRYGGTAAAPIAVEAVAAIQRMEQPQQ